MEKINKTIVAFHTGRGGSFYNAGHVTFIGTKNINEFTEDLFSTYENAYEIWNKIKGIENLENMYNEYICEGSPKSTALFKKLGFDFGKETYATSTGYYVGLYVENDGTGSIDIDGDYDTTSCIFLNDCEENELKIILRSGEWNKEDVIIEFFNECTDLIIDWSKFNGDYSGLITDYFNFFSNINVENYYEETEE
jgi:hypothetical protein